MQFGRCFEDFEIGAIYKHWPGRTITEYDDTLFSMLTMNHNPLHIDALYSEGTQHGQRLVVGPLIFSIALGISVPDVSGKAIANLEFEYVRHLGPTFHGDTIYAETTVLDKRLSSSKPDRGIVTVETIAYNQRGETVLSFKRHVLVPTRAADEAWQLAWDEKIAKLRRGPGEPEE
jgi:acyl dehydratase